MELRVIDHPLVAHKVSLLRCKDTPSPTFRQLVDELMTLLAYEGTRDVRTEEYPVTTPLTETTGTKISHPTPLVVPILRAGLGMLEGMTRLLPTAEVGFLGMARNEQTLDIVTYAERLPDDLTGRQVYVLDPMLATGGTLIEAIRFLRRRGAQDITCLCLLAAPEGLAAMEQELGDDDSSGPVEALYRDLDATWDARAARLNALLAAEDLPVRVANMSTVWTVLYTKPSRYNWMLQYYLRAEGLSLSWVGTGRLIFSLNYTEADFDEVAERFVRAGAKMKADVGSRPAKNCLAMMAASEP